MRCCPSKGWKLLFLTHFGQRLNVYKRWSFDLFGVFRLGGFTLREGLFFEYLCGQLFVSLVRGWVFTFLFCTFWVAILVPFRNTILLLLIKKINKLLEQNFSHFWFPLYMYLPVAGLLFWTTTFGFLFFLFIYFSVFKLISCIIKFPKP